MFMVLIYLLVVSSYWNDLKPDLSIIRFPDAMWVYWIDLETGLKYWIDIETKSNTFVK